MRCLLASSSLLDTIYTTSNRLQWHPVSSAETPKKKRGAWFVHYAARLSQLLNHFYFARSIYHKLSYDIGILAQIKVSICLIRISSSACYHNRSHAIRSGLSFSVIHAGQQIESCQQAWAIWCSCTKGEIFILVCRFPYASITHLLFTIICHHRLTVNHPFLDWLVWSTLSDHLLVLLEVASHIVLHVTDLQEMIYIARNNIQRHVSWSSNFIIVTAIAGRRKNAVEEKNAVELLLKFGGEFVRLGLCLDENCLGTGTGKAPLKPFFLQTWLHVIGWLLWPFFAAV